ncbi:MAG: hypothetical protein N0C88_17275 [Candidatus Thiodiazotropha lotti]|uniref:Uncharacterized protein n=1 Tax=Candidatus Thiodiazotropha lotti TaxID=2792787 RepID=A0A9E4K7C7_9GAMM|nr:hypothetical protein [Candidatus Thiodiazotropha lotti]MCW4205055.1 hypothetical protein [Candidatus Thiodiazotropha lotti]
MATFARYYKDRKLNVVPMDKLKEYITDERNKAAIAELIYYRYFERYLKLFFYDSPETANYIDENGNSKVKNVFKTEYKNGFLMIASNSLLIETLASFLNGYDKTPRGQSNNAFKAVFSKAEEYKNKLSVFKNINFYQDIRCGILHQGETYSKFRIIRTGPLFDKKQKKINATMFTKELHDFLIKYTEELKKEKWDGDLWDNCRIKLRHIVNHED